MMAHQTTRHGRWIVLGILLSTALPQTTHAATPVAREQDIPSLRVGQRVLVDDGSCPAGEIKEITGATLTPSGVTWTRKCIPRSGTKR